jgi:hypothetical protein
LFHYYESLFFHRLKLLSKFVHIFRLLGTRGSLDKLGSSSFSRERYSRQRIIWTRHHGIVVKNQLENKFFDINNLPT